MTSRGQVNISVERDTARKTDQWYVKLVASTVAPRTAILLPGYFTRRWVAVDLARHLAEAYREDGYEVALMIPKVERDGTRRRF